MVASFLLRRWYTDTIKVLYRPIKRDKRVGEVVERFSECAADFWVTERTIVNALANFSPTKCKIEIAREFVLLFGSRHLFTYVELYLCRTISCYVSTRPRNKHRGGLYEECAYCELSVLIIHCWNYTFQPCRRDKVQTTYNYLDLGVGLGQLPLLLV